MQKDLDQTEPTIRVLNEYTGTRVNVRQEVILLDDGTESVRDVIYHPNSVVIVPIDEGQNIVMVRQFRKAADLVLLELPAGVIDDDDSILEAARRELREETGLDAVKLVLLGEFFADPGTLTEKLYAYYATDLYSSPLPPDEDERISLERIPYTRLMEMVDAGEVIDGKTLASLLLVRKHLSNY